MKTLRSPEAAGSGAAGIRVLVVDDHALFRLALREHLEASGVEVVGEAGDGEGALTVAVATSPDVVLIDASLDGVSSVGVTRRLQAAIPASRILILTSDYDEEVVEALRAGACGCLLKDEEGDRILAAIAAAAAGESPLSPRVASALIQHMRESEPKLAGVNTALLTTRERQVLGLIVQGRDNNEIAKELVISPETVKTHVSAILEKLHVDNRVQAAVAAVSIGLVGLLS